MSTTLFCSHHRGVSPDVEHDGDLIIDYEFLVARYGVARRTLRQWIEKSIIDPPVPTLEAGSRRTVMRWPAAALEIMDRAVARHRAG